MTFLLVPTVVSDYQTYNINYGIAISLIYLFFSLMDIKLKKR